jgi:predicted ATPase/DNA-binding SARP family transcriptional activator
LFCRVLGSLEIEIDGVVVNLGGPGPRRLLAALTAANGSAVADSVLAELVWGSGPPANVASGLRVMVSRLRTALGPGTGQQLRRGQFGYSFDLPPGAVDHRRFSELVDDGRRRLAAAEARGAVDAFASALALWRGDPWPELADSVLASGARVALVELHGVAVEELQAARLELGDSAAAVAALSAAVGEAPYRERRWELLALGLYRGGRQAHALAELRRARSLLVDELGIEPGPELRSLESRMLTHDPTLLGPTHTAPPIPHPDPAPRSLPVAAQPGITRPLSPLVGRADELQRLDDLLTRRRLVTLTGPAGVGKTRLALEHATTQHTGEVWQARLADAHTDGDVAATVAAAAGVIHLGGDLVALIQHALADRPGLLVLDNCEHLIGPVAELTRRLLTGCPELRILTTSRAPLEVDGEHAFLLQPLPVLDDNGEDGAAVELLFERVRLHRTGWAPTDAERQVGRDICGMLDGLPLAIELAAARERAFGLNTIATHLAERLSVLGNAPRGSVNPHTSLDAAIGWSVDQLGPADRAMLLRLRPFEGGFSWQGAEAVQPPGNDAVLAVLASLVNRSVIATDTSAGPTRYRMLETIRRYCRDLDPDPAEADEAHAAWVRGLVAEQTPQLTGPRAGQVYRLLADELANIRTGIGHDLQHHPIAALRACALLEWVWVSLGVLPEGMRLLQAALDASPDAPAEDRARALLALSIGSFHAGNPVVTLRRADEALSLRGQIADRDLLLNALSRRALAAIELNDPDLARTALTQFVHEAEQGPSAAWQTSITHLAEAVLHLMDGVPEKGEAAFRAARQHSRMCGFLWGEGTADLMLAWHLLGVGPQPSRPEEALQSLSRALDTFQKQLNKSDVLGVLYAGAHALAVLMEPATAAHLHAAVLEHSHRVGVNPRRYTFLTGAEQWRSDLPTGPTLATAGHSARSMSWTAMVDLFTDAVATVTSEPAE